MKSMMPAGVAPTTTAQEPIRAPKLVSLLITNQTQKIQRTISFGG